MAVNEFYLAKWQELKEELDALSKEMDKELEVSDEMDEELWNKYKKIREEKERIGLKAWGRGE